MTPTELFTLDEAAEAARRDVRTVRRWVATGQLTPYAHVGGTPLYADAELFAVELANRRRVGRPRRAG